MVCTLNSCTMSEGGVPPAITSVAPRLTTELGTPSMVISLRLARTLSSVIRKRGFLGLGRG